MIIYIIFVHTSLYVMVLQVEKICVLNLPETRLIQSCQTLKFVSFVTYFENISAIPIEKRRKHQKFYAFWDRCSVFQCR